MSRLRRIEQAHRFFFVSTKLAPQCSPFSPGERTLVFHDLKAIRSSHDFLLFAYVVMPTHLHLLLYPREATLTDILRDLKSRSAVTLHKARASDGPIWQPRFFDFACRKVRDFWEKVEYIHQNPVRAGLASMPAEWLWSSATGGKGLAVLRPDPIELPADGNALIWPAPWR
jgi:putative transposase